MAGGRFSAYGGPMFTSALDSYMGAKKEAQTKRLVGPASAGSPEALEELMSVNPQMGMMVRDRMTQRQAAEAQAQQAAQAQQLKTQEFELKRRELERKEKADKTKIVEGQILEQQDSGEWVSKGGEASDVRKFREETRADIRKGTEKLGIAIDVVTTNRDKLVNLTDEMKKGNRTAVAQGLVALVKLNDPNSAVLNSEMEAALNNKDPKSAFLELLARKGTSDEAASAAWAALDPLNPEGINTDHLIATADAMIRSNVPSLMENYESFVEKGTNAELSEKAMKTLFGSKFKSKVDALSKYMEAPTEAVTQPIIEHPKYGSVTEEDILLTMKNNNITREQVIARLQGGQ